LVFESARQYFRYTGDLQFLRTELYDVLADIISWHLKGTRYGIKVDETGLLSSGDRDIQLTWLDAKVNEWVVTPRLGKPVEIQALWYMFQLQRSRDEGQIPPLASTPANQSCALPNGQYILVRDVIIGTQNHKR
jgi:Amylo-alpha-1,6-glucosidase